MARFRLKGKVVRFDKKSDKKLAMVVMKDSENQRHIPVWTPMFSDKVSLFEFLEAWENNTQVQVEGWLNIQPDGRIMLRAYRVDIESHFPHFVD
ncbi:MAG: hypothetical protein C4B57_02430 [Deltaproteobacteria bacterium]|nr:hypothetical protein [Deltaproteobacteria bacterium]PXF55502.1 MAG: hypothetical protein C4B57_02430 [Deltaproteobacteria bacterium]